VGQQKAKEFCFMQRYNDIGWQSPLGLYPLSSSPEQLRHTAGATDHTSATAAQFAFYGRLPRLLASQLARHLDIPHPRKLGS
jgi:hypothetical protein